MHSKRAETTKQLTLKGEQIFLDIMMQKYLVDVHTLLDIGERTMMEKWFPIIFSIHLPGI
ncbi:hypothetical protein GV64_17420 [Endozoicomonas elysicola]|uniref:Uncharacterized protein n=1 Tax=Endozoicomonas elysicola TaxID=305900 RepID=A0A081KDQ0_9GAMM|nr:hypothetical protein GV64_17420 [Endozoicomonas elysicola]